MGYFRDNVEWALAYPVPTYSLYPVLANLQDCPMIEVPFDEQFNLPSKLPTMESRRGHC